MVEEMMMVVVVVLVEEMMTEISVTMIGAGGLEAAVLDVEGNEVEALGEGEIGVLSGKVVLKEGLRLSNGIGKGNRQTLVFRTMRITLTMTAMAFNRMISIMMTLSSTSSMTDTMTSSIRLVWFVPLLFLRLIKKKKNCSWT